MHQSDEDLSREAGTGDLEAASELLDRHYQKIFGYFRRLSGNDSDASDLTQKTFCKVWNGIGGYGGRSKFSTWVHSIAHHVYVDWRRVHNRLEGQTDEWWLACPGEGPSPFDSAADKDLAGHLYGLIEQLEEEARETVHLHYYQGLSLQETADALGIASSTVKYRLRNALDVLRHRLPEEKRS
jgi:RNA polymerase sigma-70 factor (ECF subfamily)